MPQWKWRLKTIIQILKIQSHDIGKSWICPTSIAYDLREIWISNLIWVLRISIQLYPEVEKLLFFIFSSFLYHNKHLLIFHPASFIDRRTIDVFKSCYATYWFQYCFHNNRSWRVGTIIMLPVDHRDKFHFHGYQVRLSYEIIFSSRINIKTINVISMKNF